MARPTSHRNVLSGFVALCLVLVSVLTLPVASIAQTSNPPTGHSQVIAQGVDLMPTVPVAWRVATTEAEPLASATFAARTLGFAVALSDPLLVSSADGSHTLLHTGQAAFNREGASEQRSSTTADAVTHATIELIVADAADSPGTIQLQLAKDFTAPSGYRDLRLVRDTLAANESGSFPGSSGAPWVLYVTAGSVTVTSDDRTMTIDAGQAAQFTSEAEIVGDADGATWLAASIGDEVTLPPVDAPGAVSPTPTPQATPGSTADTGTLLIAEYDCPQTSDPANGDIEGCHLSPDPWEVTVGIYRGESWSMFETASVNDEGQYVMTGLPPTELVISWDASGGDIVHTEGVEMSGLVGPYVTIVAGDETEIAFYRIPPTGGDTGSLLLHLYDCPDTIDPGSGDFDGCELTSDPWDVSIHQMAENGDVEWSMFADATDLGGASYQFDNLPAETLIVSIDPDGPPGDTIVYTTGDLSYVPDVYVVEIPAGELAEASLFRVQPSTSTPAGTLTIEQQDCPNGTVVEVDASACELSTAPWEVTVTNTGTGTSWSLLDDGTMIDSGTYILSLPAGTYDIVVDSNDNWDIYTLSTITLDEGEDDSLTIYSVDRRSE